MIKFAVKSLVMCSLFAFCISCSNNQPSLNLIPVKSGEKWGYINKKGEYVINPQFQDAQFFRDGLARVVSSDGKVGYIDEDGKYEIAAKFKDGTPFREGLAFVVSDGGYPTCIDKSGNSKFELKQAKFAYWFTDGLAMFSVADDKQNPKFGYVDKSGKVVINPQFEGAHFFSEGLAAVRQNKKWGFIDKSGKIVINPQFERVGDFHNGKAHFYNGKQWGYIDTKGSYVINPQFDGVSAFSEGFAVILQGKTYGYINETGKIEINPQFEVAGSFKNGLAIILQGDKCGFINKEGKITINPQFDNASEFFGNFAFVKSADKWGIIDKEGKYLVNPQFDYMKTSFFEDGYYGYGTFVKTDFYDATAFINKFFEKAKADSFDGFTAASTLQNIVDNPVYGDDVRADNKNTAVCKNTQKITNDISVNETAFLFVNPIYENVTTYSSYGWFSYPSTSKQYKFSEKLSAIRYDFDLLGDANDKGGAIAIALKTEIERRYGIKMENKDGRYFALQDNGKYSFAISYSDYSVSLAVGFSKDKIEELVSPKDEAVADSIAVAEAMESYNY